MSLFSVHHQLDVTIGFFNDQHVQERKNRMNGDSGSYILPSSYDKLVLRDAAHFHRNDTTRRRVDSHF